MVVAAPPRYLLPDRFPLAETNPYAAEHELLSAYLAEVLAEKAYASRPRRSWQQRTLLLRLEPARQVRVVHAAMQRMDWYGRSPMLEYLSLIGALGPFTYALRDLLGALLRRRRLPLRHGDVLALARTALGFARYNCVVPPPAIGGAAFVLPVDRLTEAIERWAAVNGMSPELRAVLAQFAPATGRHRNLRVEKAALRLDRLLGRGAALPGPPPVAVGAGA